MAAGINLHTQTESSPCDPSLKLEPVGVWTTRWCCSAVSLLVLFITFKTRLRVFCIFLIIDKTQERPKPTMCKTASEFMRLPHAKHTADNSAVMFSSLLQSCSLVLGLTELTDWHRLRWDHWNSLGQAARLKQMCGSVQTNSCYWKGKNEKLPRNWSNSQMVFCYCLPGGEQQLLSRSKKSFKQQISPIAPNPSVRYDGKMQSDLLFAAMLCNILLIIVLGLCLRFGSNISWSSIFLFLSHYPVTD